MLELWQASKEAWGAGPAFYFPQLPPGLGFAESQVGKPQEQPKTTSSDHACFSGPGESLPVQPALATSDDFNSERVLQAMRPDGWFGMYVLGCYDLVKTLYTQQARALTLVHALFETGELKRDSRLGIIGGGAAGITAASAAAVKGANVVLYERAPRFMPLQSQNTKWFLHPHIYDWPKPGSGNCRAGLPLLDWEAGLSWAVAKSILLKFEKIREETGRITPQPGQTIRDITRVMSSDEHRRLRVLGPEGEINEVFDTVIVAIGFGLEPRLRFGVQMPRYWEDDGLDQALEASPDRPRRTLVSGSGDGALIDIMRATIKDFRHEDIFSLVPDLSTLDSVRRELLEIEREARRTKTTVGTSSVNLHQAYSRIAIPATLTSELSSRVRRDTRVCFNFAEAERYTTGSSILNRFLVSVLCGLGAVQPKLARLKQEAIIPIPPESYGIRWSAREEPQVFDQIVVRHGPPADYLGSVFGEIGEASLALRTKVRELDLTGALAQSTISFFAWFWSIRAALPNSAQSFPSVSRKVAKTPPGDTPDSKSR